ncbi:MAG TPA: potassium transporter Kef [Polyangiales bacterium]|nr:potassium transporter Kef [Polyangiales bacterium]
MNEMALLLGLLVVSYLGSMLLSGRALRGFGLPSGTEWVVFGFVLGPYGFAAVPADALGGFAPLTAVATAWLALALGVEYGWTGERRASLRGFALGVVFASLTVLVVGAAVFAAASYGLHMTAKDAWLVAAGSGLASAETTRHAVRWVAEHGIGPSPLLARIEEIADTDEVVPLLGLALLFASLPTPQTTLPMTFEMWLLVTAGLGLVLGSTCVMLIASLGDPADAWSVLLGAALLGTGIAWRLDVSPLTVMFLMGIVLSLLSRHAGELRATLARTESPVLLPTLLLGGALLRFDLPGVGWLIAAALLGRTLVRWLLGYVLGWSAGLKGRERRLLGFGMSSSGSVTMLIGMAFVFRFPGPIGDTVLASAACMTALGELLGPTGLRRALAGSEPPPPAAASEEAVPAP